MSGAIRLGALLVAGLGLAHCRSKQATPSEQVSPALSASVAPGASAPAAPSNEPTEPVTALPPAHGRPTTPDGNTPSAKYDVKDGWARGDGYKARIERLMRCVPRLSVPAAASSGGAGGSASSTKTTPAEGGAGGRDANSRVVLGVKVYVEGDKTLFVRSTDFSLRNGGIYVRAALHPGKLFEGCRELDRAKLLESRLLQDEPGLGGWIAFEFPERLKNDLYLEYSPTRFATRSRVALRIPACLDCPGDTDRKPYPTGERLAR